MKKFSSDMDATETIRRSPEATSSTLATYSALRELATLAGSCDFETSGELIRSRSLASKRSTWRDLHFMERRLLIHRARTSRGLRIRMLRVAKS